MIELPTMAFITWNYDGLVRRVWDDGEVFVTLERTGELYWARFEADPAYFAGQVIVQGFEDFERDGSPVDTTIDVEAIYLYLQSSRRRGTATHLLLGAETAISWKLDGQPLANPYVPGPEDSGVVTDDRVTWRAGYGPWWARVLVDPGPHVVDANGLEVRVLVDVHSQCTVVVENENLVPS